MNTEEIIQAAVFMGYEPSAEDLNSEDLLTEAEAYIFEYSIINN